MTDLELGRAPPIWRSAAARIAAAGPRPPTWCLSSATAAIGRDRTGVGRSDQRAVIERELGDQRLAEVAEVGLPIERSLGDPCGAVEPRPSSPASGS